MDNRSVQEKERREAFGSKLALEYLQFKRRMLLLSPEDVFANAYKTDICINFYVLCWKWQSLFPCRSWNS